MERFSTALSRSLETERAVEELADRIEQELSGSAVLSGGLILATAAAGHESIEVGRRLARRWPDATFLGTSFEGILADGRIFRDEPAYLLLAWSEGPFEPIPFVFESGAQDAARVAEGILDVAGRSELTAADLVLLFPDELGSPEFERVFKELGPLLGNTSMAGAAATGVDGHPAPAFLGDEVQPGALVGLFVPGTSSAAAAPIVRRAAASRPASPWLEITKSRPRWIDELEGERPLDWVRRQLGLEQSAAIEPHLDRLLARVRRREASGENDRGLATNLLPLAGETYEYEERYIIGIDERRGSISLPGTSFRTGDKLAFALPDPQHARELLSASIDELAETPLILQFVCRARDGAFYGDPDLDSAWAAYRAPDRRIIGTVSSFQLAMSGGEAPHLLVHATVLAALGK